MSNVVLEDLYPALWRFAAATCGSTYDPDDVLQEAVVRTLRRHDVAELDHPAAYIRKAIVSVVVDEARRRRRSPLVGGIAIDQLPDGRPAEYPSDLSELLRLEPRDRSLLYLVDVEGRGFGEAARIIGCSTVTARKRASRARHALRQAIEQEVAE